MSILFLESRKYQELFEDLNFNYENVCTGVDETLSLDINVMENYNGPTVIFIYLSLQRIKIILSKGFYTASFLYKKKIDYNKRSFSEPEVSLVDK